MRKLSLILAMAVMVGACSAGEPAATTVPTTSGATTTTTGPTASSLTTTAPPSGRNESAVDARFEWLAEVLEAGELTESEYRATFTSDFISNVPYEQFVEVVDQIASLGTGWTVGEFESREGLTAVALIVSGKGQAVRADISLESVVPHRISGLLLQPAEPPTLEDPPSDLESAAARLGELGTVEMAVMEVADGACEPVFESGEGSPSPVGSAIKLYVLAAVADTVASGGLAWDDDIPISEEHKSIPTGVMQDEEEGTTFSLREMAEAMIAISDNTATDHLINLVGREAVEQALADYGMAEPGLNIPFMNTMELTALKLGPASGLATQWLEAGEASRRGILEQISDITPADIPLAEFNRPLMPDQIEWFATPADMCRVLMRLDDLGEPLTQILTINPGIPDEEELFEVVAFKGGSEPGLVSMNWLVERPDGRRFVVAGSVVNAEEDFDQLEAILLFGAARDLVAVP